MSQMDRDLDLTGLTDRLRASNPGFSEIRAEAPTKPEAGVRVVVETTREELNAINGQLHLDDPELEGLRIETAIRFLDRQPGERINVEMKRE